MVSYIYGIIYPIDDLIAYCKERGILVVEDVAESYIGNDYIGHPLATMSLFSFGGIKRYTSFGGALAFIRGKSLFTRMEEIQNSYPVQKKREVFRKVYKIIAVGLLLNNKYANRAFKEVSKPVGFNYKEFAVKNLRY